MRPRRVDRVNELLLREISNYVLENQPPGFGFITFLGVSVTEDLEQAKVFYSVLGNAEEQARTSELLEGMKFDIKRQMRRLESLRRLPELHFVFDNTPARAARLHEIIEDLHKPALPPPRQRRRPKTEI